MKVRWYWHDWYLGRLETREWRSLWIGPLAIFWDKE